MVIILVGQRYKFTKSKQDYRTGTGMTYRKRDVFMVIEKAKENFDKDGKPRYFNCNIYGYMVKDC